jgi:hypothetical protein
MLKRLGITRLGFRESSVMDSFAAMMRGRPMDLGLAAKLTHWGLAPGGHTSAAGARDCLPNLT